MIKSLVLCDVATYPPPPSSLTVPDLTTVNFFFGANASGKTTISCVIANIVDHPKCSITWHPATPLECLVYNRDFRDRNFNEAGPLKGVFTLGEENAQHLEQIEEKREQITKKSEKITNLMRMLDGDGILDGQRSKLQSLLSSFGRTCWDQKKKHEELFKLAFKGSMGSEKDFRDKIISEQTTNNATAVTLNDLTQRAKTVFATSPSPEATLTQIDYPTLEVCETDDILAKVVVGSSDVEIAALIRTLKNGDWVNEGRKYIDQSGGKCPLCQQSLPSNLEAQFTQFFDKTYADDCKAIDDLLEGYERDSQALKDAIKVLIDSGSVRIDINQLRNYSELIGAIVAENIEHLKKKKREPSTKIELKAIGEVCGIVKGMIDTANVAISEHNARVRNLPNEKKTLTAQVWRYLLDVELKADLEKFTSEKTSFDAAIRGLEMSLRDTERERQALISELQELERQTTSVKPTMDAINRLLSSFGFTTFKLVESETSGMYELQRANGTPVHNTLSDGEKTFLTFLYFYHLISGSESSTGANNRRVVVFDDPISSLDSDVLFVVSSLVKNVFEMARDPVSHVAQVFVLTHNIYFHKEITFNIDRRSGKPFADESFWIIRRNSSHSSVERYSTNPIKSSYELLWSEVRNPQLSPNTICNAMRRILEYYFKMLGRCDLHDLQKKFDGDEKAICKSLVSWIHDGSHFAMEDLYLSKTTDEVHHYHTVFRKVFAAHGHEAHYRMMMGDDDIETTTALVS